MKNYVQIFNNLTEPIILLNSKGIIEYANYCIKDLTGYDQKDLIGKRLNILLPSENRAVHSEKIQMFFKAPVQRKMGKGKWFDLQTISGELIPIEVSLSPIEIENETYCFAILINVSEKKKQLEEAVSREQFYHLLLENNIDHIFHLDPKLNIVYINSVAPGLNKETVVGTNLLDLLPNTKSKDHVRKVLQKSFHDGKPVTYDIEYPSPIGVIYYSTSVTPIITDGQVIGANLISRNITEEVKTKKDLLDTKSFVNKLNKFSLNGMYIYHLKLGRNIYINDRYKDILGYSMEEINRMSQKEFFDLFHPDDAQAISDHMNTVMSLKEGESTSIEYRFKAKKGEWVWCLSKDSGFEYDEKGNLLSFIGTFIDITELKETEFQLRRKSKEIENFVYIVSHDLKSPLNSLKQLIELTHYENSEVQMKEILNRASESIDRMKELVVSLLDHSLSEEKLTLESIDLNLLLKKITEDLSHDISKVNATIDLPASFPTISAYRILLRQVFQNLISNALKFTLYGVTPMVQVRCTEHLEYYLFEIEDNGVGISKEHQKSIFELFKKLDHDNSGYGIGLANCKQIISKHKGNIWVESELGKGSTFFFTVSKSLQEKPLAV